MSAFRRVSGGSDPQQEESAYRTAREEMVREHMQGRLNPISDPRVLAAMRDVPRHCFVPPEYRHLAYTDQPLPLGHGQTISQPSLIALMCQELRLDPSDKVLEIGTGCGYHAAILSQLAAQVYTVEIIPELSETAAATLRHLRFTNVHLRVADGHRGWPENAPYNAIVITCAPSSVPNALAHQLAEGGRLILPLQEWGDQTLTLFHKHHQHLVRQALVPVRFVPMIHR